MPDEGLVVERIKESIKKLTPEERKKPSIFRMDGRTFTPDQVLEEVEKDTTMGKMFKKAEEKMLQRTLDKKKAAGL